MSETPRPGLVTALLLGFADFAEPLLDAFDSPEAMEVFWYERGWRVSLDDAVLAAVGQVLPVADAAPELRRLTGSLRAELAAGTPPTPDDVGLLAEIVARVGRAISEGSAAAPSGLPAPLDDPATWEAFAEELADSLLERFLRLHHRVLHLVLMVTGVLRYERVPASPPWRVPYVRPVLDWSQAAAYVDDPAAALARAYRWDDPAAPFDHERLLDVVALALHDLGLGADRIVPGVHVEAGLPADVVARLALDADGLRGVVLQGLMIRDRARYEVGFDLLPARSDPQTAPDGLVLRPRLIGSTSQVFQLGERFELTLTAAADIGALLSVSFFPGAVSMTGGDVAIGTSVEARASTPDPWYVLGTPAGSRIEVRSPALKVSLEGTSSDAELRVRLGTQAGQGKDGALVVLDMSEADSFLQDSLSGNGIRVGFTPEVLWFSRTGLAVNGEPRPQVTLPATVHVGSFTVSAVTVSLERPPGAAGSAALRLRAAADLAGSVGPVAVVVRQVGFGIDVLPYTRDELRALPESAPRPVLGRLGLELGFAPPRGAGLTVDAAGVVTGGGFVDHDPAQGLYSGVLQLTLHERLTLTAVGLLSTRLPDGRPGWSMLLIITAEDFEPIPVGMGFFLTGIGGLVGIHRTADDAAMRAALTSGAVASALFPQDPVANAPAVIRTLGTLFPARRGSHLIGIMLRLGRDVPPIELDLAVVYEFGARHRLVVLGRITSLMPSAEEDLVHLRLDAVGVVDLDQATVAIDAVLVESTIAHSYALSGAMALRARLRPGPGAGFVLAIGGFNPHFTPPPGVPALDRVSIALAAGSNPRFTCEAYLALTSNTIQFGADASLHAAAHGFSIDGDVGFDVLIERDPFGFIADFHASIQLKHGSTNLFMVKVKGQLQGPRPLRVSGTASFEICWCDFDVRFDKTLVDGERPPLPPAPDVAAALETALGDVHAWAARPPAAGRGQPVAVRARPKVTGLVLDPFGVLQVTQQVVPLATARDLDLFAGAPLEAARRFDVSVGLGVAGQQLAPVAGQFAPAQFFAMSEDEKLAAPSFEQMTSGYEVAAGGWLLDDAQIAADGLEFDTFLLDVDAAGPSSTEPAPPTRGAPHRPQGASLAALLGQRTAAAGRERFRVSGVEPAAALRAPAWRVVSTADLSRTADGGSAIGTYAEARASARDLQSGGGPGDVDVRAVADWQVVAVWDGGP